MELYYFPSVKDITVRFISLQLLSANYGINRFREFGKTEDGKNKVAVVSLNYTF